MRINLSNKQVRLIILREIMLNAMCILNCPKYDKQCCIINNSARWKCRKASCTPTSKHADLLKKKLSLFHVQAPSDMIFREDKALLRLL